MRARRLTIACLLLTGLVSPTRAGVDPQVPVASRDPAGAGAQQPPAGTAVMSGTLVAVDTGRPVRRARVTLTNTDRGEAKSTTSDDQGHFAFMGLQGGRYMLTANKPGYLDASYGQKRPGSGRAGTPIALVDGQKIENLRLQIPKGGVITGVVVDEQGDPAFGTPVRAMRYVMRTGERTLQTAGSGTTDDRGVYRIAGLLPGEYLVSAMPRDTGMSDAAMADMKMTIAANPNSPAADEMKKVFEAQAQASSETSADSGYAPVYYPSTLAPSTASTVTLDISEEKTGIDIPLQIVPLQRISGTILSAEGALPQGVSVTLMDATGFVPGLPTRNAKVSPDGKFTFTGVAPGQYTAIARSSPVALMMASVAAEKAVVAGKAALDPGAPPPVILWAMADVTTDGRSPVTISLVLQQGVSVSGRVVLDRAAANVDLTRQVRVQVAPVGQGPIADLGSFVRTVAPDAEDRFSLAGVPPGKYRVSTALTPPGWSLKSSIIAGQDTLDLPLEVRAGENVAGAVLTLSNQPTVVSGTLLSPSGQPSADYTVVIFPTENRFWVPQSRRVQATRPGTDGRFAVRGLPAGEYRLVAVSDIEPGQWYDPALLRQLFASSIELTLADSERKTQDVRVR